MTNFFQDCLAAWASDDVDKVLAFYHDDIVYEDTTIAHKATGMKHMRYFVKASFTNAPGAYFDYVSSHTDGTGFAMEWIMQPMNVRGVSIGKLQDGKISEQRDYWDGRKFTVPNT
jgi:ketosteroid isomerase-like protein